MQMACGSHPLMLDNEPVEASELQESLRCIDLTDDMAAALDFGCIENIDYVWRITRSLPVRLLNAAPQDCVYRDSQLPEDLSLFFDHEVDLISELLHRQFRLHLNRELDASDQFHALLTKQAAVLTRSCQALFQQFGRQSSLDTDLISDAGSTKPVASPKHPMKQDLATICLVPLIRACRELCCEPRQLQDFSRILLEQLASMFKMLMDREGYTVLDDAILPELREVFFACSRNVQEDGKRSRNSTAFQGPMGMLVLGVIWRSLGDLMLGLAMLIESIQLQTSSHSTQQCATDTGVEVLRNDNTSLPDGVLPRKRSKSQLLRALKGKPETVLEKPEPFTVQSVSTVQHNNSGGLPPPIRRKSGSKSLLSLVDIKSKLPPELDAQHQHSGSLEGADTDCAFPINASAASVAAAIDWVTEEFYRHNQHFCDGPTAVYSCGQNEYGELAHGDTTQRSLFSRVQMFDDKGVIAIGAGNEHTIMLTNDGTVFASGYNDNGQCGMVTPQQIRDPLVITAFQEQRIQQIHAYNGCEHSVVVTHDGKAYSFGYNYRGQLGTGHTGSEPIPKPIKGLDNLKVVKVACSYYHTVLVCQTGQAFSFGRNDFGQLGHGDLADKNSAHLIQTPPGVPTDVSCGHFHTVFAWSDGGAVVCGKNDYGQLGSDNVELVKVPARLPDHAIHSRVKGVKCGYYHTLALTDGGVVYGCGRNDYGQLGLGFTSQRVHNFQCILGLQGKVIQHIGAGCYHTICSASNGVLYAFGRNNHGQLGTGDREERHLPEPIGTFVAHDIVALAAGFYHSVVLTVQKGRRLSKCLPSIRTPWPQNTEQEQEQEQEQEATATTNPDHTLSTTLQQLLAAAAFDSEQEGSEQPQPAKLKLANLALHFLRYIDEHPGCWTAVDPARVQPMTFEHVHHQLHAFHTVFHACQRCIHSPSNGSRGMFSRQEALWSLKILYKTLPVFLQAHRAHLDLHLLGDDALTECLELRQLQMGTRSEPGMIGENNDHYHPLVAIRNQVLAIVFLEKDCALNHQLGECAVTFLRDCFPFFFHSWQSLLQLLQMLTPSCADYCYAGQHQASSHTMPTWQLRRVELLTLVCSQFQEPECGLRLMANCSPNEAQDIFELLLQLRRKLRTDELTSQPGATVRLPWERVRLSVAAGLDGCLPTLLRYCTATAIRTSTQTHCAVVRSVVHFARSKVAAGHVDSQIITHPFCHLSELMAVRQLLKPALLSLLHHVDVVDCSSLVDDLVLLVRCLDERLRRSLHAGIDLEYFQKFWLGRRQVTEHNESLDELHRLRRFHESRPLFELLQLSATVCFAISARALQHAPLLHPLAQQPIWAMLAGGQSNLNRTTVGWAATALVQQLRREVAKMDFGYQFLHRSAGMVGAGDVLNKIETTILNAMLHACGFSNGCAKAGPSTSKLLRKLYKHVQRVVKSFATVKVSNSSGDNTLTDLLERSLDVCRDVSRVLSSCSALKNTLPTGRRRTHPALRRVILITLSVVRWRRFVRTGGYEVAADAVQQLFSTALTNQALLKVPSEARMLQVHEALQSSGRHIGKLATSMSMMRRLLESIQSSSLRLEILQRCVDSWDVLVTAYAQQLPNWYASPEEYFLFAQERRLLAERLLAFLREAAQSIAAVVTFNLSPEPNWAYLLLTFVRHPHCGLFMGPLRFGEAMQQVLFLAKELLPRLQDGVNSTWKRGRSFSQNQHRRVEMLIAACVHALRQGGFNIFRIYPNTEVARQFFSCSIDLLRRMSGTLPARVWSEYSSSHAVLDPRGRRHGTNSTIRRKCQELISTPFKLSHCRLGRTFQVDPVSTNIKGIDYSLAFWLYLHNNHGSAPKMILGKIQDHDVWPLVFVRPTDNRLEIVYGRNSEYEQFWSRCRLPTYSWIHIVIVVDPRKIKLYINGVCDSLQSTCGHARAITFPLMVGSCTSGTDANLPFSFAGADGVINRMKYYTRSLSPIHIRAIYDQGPPDDFDCRERWMYQLLVSPQNHCEAAWFSCHHAVATANICFQLFRQCRGHLQIAALCTCSQAIDALARLWEEDKDVEFQGVDVLKVPGLAPFPVSDLRSQFVRYLLLVLGVCVAPPSAIQDLYTYHSQAAAFLPVPLDSSARAHDLESAGDVCEAVRHAFRVLARHASWGACINVVATTLFSGSLDQQEGSKDLAASIQRLGLLRLHTEHFHDVASGDIVNAQCEGRALVVSVQRNTGSATIALMHHGWTVLDNITRIKLVDLSIVKPATKAAHMLPNESLRALSAAIVKRHLTGCKAHGILLPRCPPSLQHIILAYALLSLAELSCDDPTTLETFYDPRCIEFLLNAAVLAVNTDDDDFTLPTRAHDDSGKYVAKVAGWACQQIVTNWLCAWPIAAAPLQHLRQHAPVLSKFAASGVWGAVSIGHSSDRALTQQGSECSRHRFMSIVSNNLSLVHRVLGSMFNAIVTARPDGADLDIGVLCDWCEHLLRRKHPNAVDIAFELLEQLLDVQLADLGSTVLIHCASIWRLLREQCESSTCWVTSPLQHKLQQHVATIHAWDHWMHSTAVARLASLDSHILGRRAGTSFQHSMRVLLADLTCSISLLHSSALREQKLQAPLLKSCETVLHSALSELLPVKPRVIAGDTSLSITWRNSFVSQSLSGAPLTFEVQIAVKLCGKRPCFDTIYRGHLLSLEHADVDGGVTYLVRVRAWVGFEKSDWSEPSEGTPLAKNVIRFDACRAGVDIMISNSGLTASYMGIDTWSTVLALPSFVSDVNHWEIKISRSPNQYVFVGVASVDAELDTFLGGDSHGWGYIGESALYHDREKMRSYGQAFREGDVVGITLDLISGTLSFSRNGQPLGVAFENMFGEFCPAVAMYSSDQVVEIMSSTVHLAAPSTLIPHRTQPQNQESLNLFAAMVESSTQRRSCLSPSQLLAVYEHWAQWNGDKIIRKRLLNNMNIFIEKGSDAMSEAGLRHSQRIRTEMGTGTIVGEAHGVVWLELDGANTVWFDDIDILPGDYQRASEDPVGVESESDRCSLDFRTFTELIDSAGWSCAMDRQLIVFLERLAVAAEITVWAVDAATILDHFRTVQHLLSKEVLKDHLLLQKWGIAGPKRKAVLGRVAFLRLFNHLAEHLLQDMGALCCDELEYESRDQCDKEKIIFIRGKQANCEATSNGDYDCNSFVPIPCNSCGATSKRVAAQSALLVNLQRVRHMVFRQSKMDLWWSAIERTTTHPTRAEDEYDYPEELPQVQLNRFRCSRAREQLLDACVETMSSAMVHHYRDLAMQHSLFEQLWGELRELPTKALRISYVHPMDDHQARTFRVRFDNEGVDDYGGPYREVFENVCAELQRMWHGTDTRTQQDHIECALPLLLPSPNLRARNGEDADSFVFLPGPLPLRAREQYRFFGQLIGIALRSRLVLPLRLASFIWQLIVEEEPTIDDISSYDAATADKLRYLTQLQDNICHGNTEQLADAAAALIDVTWTVGRADGVQIALRPEGNVKEVAEQDLRAYIEEVLCFKRQEFADATECVREGLASVIPACSFALLAWRELRELVCGTGAIDVDFLAENTEYDEDVSPDDAHVLMLWSVLKKFSEADKQLFLRFVWGRSSLPGTSGELTQKFKIQSAVGEGADIDPDSYLPKAHTCFFSLNLPRYSSEKVLADRLLYAIQNCTELDADYRLGDQEVLSWEPVHSAGLDRAEHDAAL